MSAHQGSMVPLVSGARDCRHLDTVEKKSRRQPIHLSFPRVVSTTARSESLPYRSDSSHSVKKIPKETSMLKFRSFLGMAMSLLLAAPPGAFASSHREAPITALDHKADITDFYAFVSYDHPDRVTFIMNVDPFQIGRAHV